MASDAPVGRLPVGTPHLAPVGRLADGTAHFAPVGRLLADGDRVCCHLCGRWFLSVASHLRHHGWSKADYVTAFGLEFTNPLSGEATHKRRSAALTARQAVDPAIQRAQAAARARSGSGALAAAAAHAARGRPQPAERRAKTLAALARIDPAARSAGSRRRAEEHRARIAAEVAARFGFATFAGYLADRLGGGMSMAAISREAGLHKDWVGRHSPRPGPVARPHRADLRLAPAAHRLGFVDVAAYLRATHLGQHRSVAAIAAEAGVSRWTVLAALRRHGITAVPHATKRYQASDRRRSAAAALGFESLERYVAERRARGAAWRELAAESGIAGTTLRRLRG